jgi:hypothetical protein
MGTVVEKLFDLVNALDVEKDDFRRDHFEFEIECCLDSILASDGKKKIDFFAKTNNGKTLLENFIVQDSSPKCVAPNSFPILYRAIRIFNQQVQIEDSQKISYFSSLLASAAERKHYKMVEYLINYTAADPFFILLPEHDFYKQGSALAVAISDENQKAVEMFLGFSTSTGGDIENCLAIMEERGFAAPVEKINQLLEVGKCLHQSITASEFGCSQEMQRHFGKALNINKKYTLMILKLQLALFLYKIKSHFYHAEKLINLFFQSFYDESSKFDIQFKADIEKMKMSVRNVATSGNKISMFLQQRNIISSPLSKSLPTVSSASVVVGKSQISKSQQDIISSAAASSADFWDEDYDDEEVKPAGPKV